MGVEIPECGDRLCNSVENDVVQSYIVHAEGFRICLEHLAVCHDLSSIEGGVPAVRPCRNRTGKVGIGALCEVSCPRGYLHPSVAVIRGGGNRFCLRSLGLCSLFLLFLRLCLFCGSASVLRNERGDVLALVSDHADGAQTLDVVALCRKYGKKRSFDL